MANKLIQIFLILFKITISSPRFIGKERHDVSEKKIFKGFDVPTICRKSSFLETHVNSGKEVTPKELKQLAECGMYYPSCAQEIKKMWGIYAIDSDGKNWIVLLIKNMQGCWGYQLRVTDELGTKSMYFNFHKESQDFTKYFHFRLGFKYNFTVTSLPSGKSLSIVTSAPNRCELEVMLQIFQKFQKQKDFFKKCKTPPSYGARKKVAARTCKKYPLSNTKREKVTEKLLVEEECKFVLLSENAVDASRF